MKTYEEAKATAIAAGIPEAAITADDIALYEHDVMDPIAKLTPAVAVDPDTVKKDLALLSAEAASNNWSATALSALKRLGPSVLKLLIPMLLLALCLGGCASTQAQNAAKQANDSVQTLNQGHLDFEEGFIQDYRSREFARIDELYAAAIKSHTVMITRTDNVPQSVQNVGPDGKPVGDPTTVMKSVTTQVPMIDPGVFAALLNQKVQLYAQVESNTIGWRKKQAAIQQNAANASAYLAGLNDYFKQKADTMALATELSTQFIDYMDRFLQTKTANIKADVTAPGILTPAPAK